MTQQDALQQDKAQQDESQQHHLVAYLDPGPEASERAILLLRRKNFRILRFSLQPASDDSFSQLDLVIEGDASTAGLIRANLEKLISVRRVVISNAAREPARSLALVRLEPDFREDAVKQLCLHPEVRILERGPSGALLEIVAAAEDIDSWIDCLRPFGIAAVSRSAAVSLADVSSATGSPADVSPADLSSANTASAKTASAKTASTNATLTEAVPTDNDPALAAENPIKGIEDHG